MRKKWIRGGIFLCLVLLLLNNLNRVLCVKSPHGVDQTRYLYVQPKNKIDVLFLGSSHVHCNVNTQLLWDEYGMAAYLMTGAEQPLWNSYYNLKEALKNQKPKLVVLDMFCPSRFYDDFQPGWADENLDGMRISLNKLEAVYTSVQEEQSHFFLGFTEYHSRYDPADDRGFSEFRLESENAGALERLHAAKPPRRADGAGYEPCDDIAGNDRKIKGIF